MRRFAGALGCALMAAALAGEAAAQGHNIRNADMRAVTGAGGLEEMVEGLVQQQKTPAWIGWVVPRVEGGEGSCCQQNGITGCQLEGGGESVSGSVTAPIPLEGASSLQVLARVEEGRLTRLRGYSGDCPLDAGGRTVYWLGARPGAESVRFLSAYVEGPGPRGVPAEEGKLGREAIGIVALHAGEEAEEALGRFVAPSQGRATRKTAAFWLGAARGARGLEILRDVIRKDEDEGFRREAVFAIHVSKEEGALEELIRLARQDSSTQVRRQAVFWLAQRAGEKAAAAVRDAIEADPDTEVKKRAVFALSQLPKDEGIPLLIEVASGNRNREVRKQALFWLGQSGDARALQFIEDLLTK